MARWSEDAFKAAGFKLNGNIASKKVARSLDDARRSCQKAVSHQKGTRVAKGGFRSKFEAKIAADLKMRQIKYGYETKTIPYTLDCEYKPDFIIGDKLIESKGWFRPADRRKMLALKEQHRCLKFCLLFQDASKTLTKKSKTTYAKWATRNGFEWSQGQIPDEWISI